MELYDVSFTVRTKKMFALKKAEEFSSSLTHKMISERDKDMIFTMRDLGATWSQIGEKLGKTPDAVRMYFARNAPYRNYPPKDKVSKKLTNGRIGLAIKKKIHEDPNFTSRDLEKYLQVTFGPSIRTPKKSTINNFLLTNDLKMIKLWKKPLISKRNQQKRAAFALIELENPDQICYETIWSDETTVRKMPKDKELYIRCHGSTKREDLPHNLQVQQGGFSVMFWGCFSAYGLGPLVALEGKQNQHTYTELLKEYLVPEFQAAKQEFDIQFRFMQDNAPCHKTNKVMNFLRANKIPTIDWPPQSPDLNPIENLWAIIKDRRQKKFGFATTKDDLIEQIFEIWEEIDIELCGTLCDSVENRLKEVVRLSGRVTKY